MPRRLTRVAGPCLRSRFLTMSMQTPWIIERPVRVPNTFHPKLGTDTRASSRRSVRGRTLFQRRTARKVPNVPHWRHVEPTPLRDSQLGDLGRSDAGSQRSVGSKGDEGASGRHDLLMPAKEPEPPPVLCTALARPNSVHLIRRAQTFRLRRRGSRGLRVAWSSRDALAKRSESQVSRPCPNSIFSFQGSLDGPSPRSPGRFCSLRASASESPRRARVRNPMSRGRRCAPRRTAGGGEAAASPALR